ncbi:MAG: hypothetical protein FWF45_00545 [Coriobacteriia bacterium]|nr:hypothetical protein [Coriobacteriia bacterium]
MSEEIPGCPLASSPEPESQRPCDLWRIRIVRIEEYADFDFEWHDDILYREHHGEDIPIRSMWRVDLLSKTSGELKRALQSFESRDAAESLAARVTDQSYSLSVANFMEQYLVDR